MGNTVLLVDDDEIFHFYVRTLFAKHPSVKLLEAYDGKEALDLLATMRIPPRIIFLDLNMPVMNGIDFLESWTRQYGRAKTKVVVVTSSDLQSDKDATSRFPAVKDYVVKPDVGNSLKNHIVDKFPEEGAGGV